MNSQLFCESLVKKSVLLVFFLGFLVIQLSAEANFCGRKDPEPDKVCISTRLPWQQEPIYFCTDKGNIKYRNQCGNRPLHCENHWSPDTLLVATPWDCCTLVSVPDQCQNTQCPPKPFNRTCEVIQPKTEEPWDCCPKYACQKMGQGGQADCHLQQLELGCMSPPKDKTNCVGFIDPHVGCCTQFQCDGEGKPGMCPMQVAAMKYSSMTPVPGTGMEMEMPSNPMNMTKSKTKSPMDSMMGSIGNMQSHDTGRKKTMNRRAATMKPKGNNVQSSNVNMVVGGESGVNNGDLHRAGSYNSYAGSNFQSGGYAGGNQHSVSIAVEPYPQHPPHSYAGAQYNLGCTGDYNCPGTMKCCSHDMTVYSDGSAVSRNTHPTYGYCVEPDM